MAENLLEVLESVGYKGPLLKDNKLSHALELGPKSTEYTALIAWFAEQIKTFINIDETIHPTTTPEDASSFLLELSCFLKEIGCMNQNLTTGNVNQRLNTKESKTLLLEILIAELMACKFSAVKDVDSNLDNRVFLVFESDTAKHLKDMLVALQFPKPPSNITTEILFSKLENKLKEVISKVPKDLLGRPLFFGKLSNDQWDKLSKYDEELRTEYEIRRNMLLTRLDVTIQSFLWSERVRARENEIDVKYRSSMSQMDTTPKVQIVDLLAARDDLAVMEKTSNATVRCNTRSRINNVIIGDVPDRGGRAHEQEPPPPEMPPWQKDRVAGPPSSGGYSRGGNTGGSGGWGGGGGARGGNRGGKGRGGGGGGGRGGGEGAGATYGNNAGYGVGGSGGGAGYGNNAGYGGGNSGGASYVNTGYASSREGYGGGNNYSGGEGRNNYGGAGGNYVGGGGGGGGSNYNNSNYSGGASYGNNRGRGNYYNSGGTGNKTSEVYHNYNDAAGNYGQDYQHNSGRGGRVQGGWNQGGHNATRNDYQRDGYNRGRGRGKRQY